MSKQSVRRSGRKSEKGVYAHRALPRGATHSVEDALTTRQTGEASSRRSRRSARARTAPRSRGSRARCARAFRLWKNSRTLVLFVIKRIEEMTRMEGRGRASPRAMWPRTHPGKANGGLPARRTARPAASGRPGTVASRFGGHISLTDVFSPKSRSPAQGAKQHLRTAPCPRCAPATRERAGPSERALVSRREPSRRATRTSVPARLFRARARSVRASRPRAKSTRWVAHHVPYIVIIPTHIRPKSPPAPALTASPTRREKPTMAPR